MDAYKMRTEYGLTFRVIGERLGVSKQRAFSMVYAERKNMRAQTQQQLLKIETRIKRLQLAENCIHGLDKMTDADRETVLKIIQTAINETQEKRRENDNAR